MADVVKGNEWVNIDPLGLRSKDGRISVSIRNGYPRFTWFHWVEKGEPAKFFTAPMDQKMFMCLSSIIGVVARSKVDIKKSLECSNRDFTTKEKFIQAVIIVAKRGNKVILGMKNGGHDVKAVTVEFSLGEYGKVFTDDSPDDTGSIEAALAYAEYMKYVLTNHTGTLAINSSVPNTVRNEIDKKNKESEANEKPTTVDTPVVKDDDVIDEDIGF